MSNLNFNIATKHVSPLKYNTTKLTFLYQY